MNVPIVEPCPKCGTVPSYADVAESQWDITCPKCGYNPFNGVYRSSLEDALRIWNTKACNYKLKEAKPCPFCGSTGENFLYFSYGKGGITITCDECGARKYGCDCCEKAIEEWNKRK